MKRRDPKDWEKTTQRSGLYMKKKIRFNVLRTREETRAE